MFLAKMNRKLHFLLLESLSTFNPVLTFVIRIRMLPPIPNFKQIEGKIN